MYDTAEEEEENDEENEEEKGEENDEEKEEEKEKESRAEGGDSCIAKLSVSERGRVCLMTRYSQRFKAVMIFDRRSNCSERTALTLGQDLARSQCVADNS
jgi:hypothetical protein